MYSVRNYISNDKFKKMSIHFSIIFALIRKGLSKILVKFQNYTEIFILYHYGLINLGYRFFETEIPL